MAIKVLHVDRDGADMPGDMALPEGSLVRMMVWPGMGAKKGVLHFVKYAAGHTSVAHQHPDAEDIGYIIEGSGFILEHGPDGEEIARHPFEAGSVLYVEPGTMHSHMATTPLVMVGGPCPPDEAFYRSFGMKW
jgi:quercetin dioxygenase-like cupin family protein